MAILEKYLVLLHTFPAATMTATIMDVVAVIFLILMIDIS
jgi:hypothetical protein